MQALLRSLPELPPSIELPANLFRLLVDELCLSRAAFLVPDYDEQLFVPWAHKGFDATTLHRLKIPAGEMNRIGKDAAGGLYLRGDPLGELAGYFSRREAISLEQLFVFPFTDASGIRAVLLVADSDYFGTDEHGLQLVLAALGESAARVIGRQRQRYAESMRYSVVFRSDEIDLVARRTAEQKGTVTLVVIELSDIVSQVATANSYIDPFRVWQDVLRAFAALFASTARLCDAGSHRALLCLHEHADGDLDLVAHQVAHTLLHLLPELAATPVLPYGARHYPADGSDIAALVRSML